MDLPSRLDQAIQYYSCFISCSSNDEDFADRIHADLQNNRGRCWLDDAVTDPDTWAAKLRARDIGDFRHWKDRDGYKQGLERVLRDLKCV